ncbi:type VI secretion system protein [Arenibaculum pallidiluteum]|uniref:type VI secretion system protein n=1 Tax=Arenibaculum pallidiluteum TaxID=2812559 RepID=UPI001A957D03|nr:type VI secretion system protein [Arenibaculum pallidiluteum]
MMSMVETVFAVAASNQLLVLGVLAFLVLLTVLLMAVAVVKAKRAARADVPPAPGDGKADLELVAIPVGEEGALVAKREAAAQGARNLRRLMRDGLAAYREAYARNPYLVPWVLRVGVGEPDDAGVLSALDETRPAVGDARREGVAWHLYDRGVVIDVHDPESWGEVLSFVSRQRPANPIDGILLTVPVSALSDARRAAARGAEAYTRLWQAQRQLGFAVPVYVVITGGESLEGFAAFEETLPAGLRDGMIGWSFPYALETAFTGEYVGEALHTVEEAMLAASLEAFGSVMESHRGSDILKAREEIRGLEEPLRLFLTTALRRTAYQESLFFRGIYLTARPDADRPASFAHDLLEKKVLAESGLSKLLQGASRSRLFRRYAWPVSVAAASAAAVATVWVSLVRVEQYRGLMVPILRATAADIEAVAGRRQADATATADAYVDAAVRYMRNVTVLDRSEPMVFMPLTWLGEDPYGVQAAMEAGWRKIVLGAVKRTIEQRLEGLARPGGGDVAADQAFVRYLGRVAEAEAFAKAFNQIGRGGADLPIRDMLQYGLQIQVPRSSIAKLEAWGAIGAGASPVDDPDLRIDTARYRDGALSAFKELADAYFRQLANGGQVGARLAIVSVELGFIASGRRAGPDAVAGFTEVLAGLEDAAGLLGVGQASWVGADQPFLPPNIQELLDVAASSELLGPASRDESNQLARRRYDEIRGQVGSVSSVIGPLVARNADGTASLTSTADGLRQSLAQWMGRRFMQWTAPGSLEARAGARGFGWDASVLEAIPPLFEDYLLFEAKDLPQVPQALRPAMRSAAQHGLTASVERALERAGGGTGGLAAERETSIAVMRDWARSLRTAFPVLDQAVQTFVQLGMPQPAEALKERVVQQAAMLLRQANRIIEEDQLYRPSQLYLSGWRSGPIEPHAFFGQPSPGGLMQWMVTSRVEIATLAREIASPMIEILSRPTMQSPQGSALSSRWLQVVTAIEQYDGGRPNSTLALLERFVTEELGKIDDRNCLQLGPSPAASIDFFADRLEGIRTAVRQRCLALVDEKLALGYQELATIFNERLSGRAPFDQDGKGLPASLADVREFYAAFDARSADVVAPVSAAARTRGEWREAARFVEAMAQARPLLMQVAQPEPNTALLVDPVFRANRERETGGSEIIEWRLSVGERSVSNFGPREKPRWLPGDRVTLELRWAKDGTVIPAEARGPGALEVDGRIARFGREGAWSLVSFLKEREVTARDRTGDLRPGTVLTAFEVATKSAEGSPTDGRPVELRPGEPAKASDTRVFVSFQLRKATEADGRVKEEPLALPRLPVVAPQPAAMARGPGFGAQTVQAPAGTSTLDEALFRLGQPAAGPAAEPRATGR